MAEFSYLSDEDGYPLHLNQREMQPEERVYPKRPLYKAADVWNVQGTMLQMLVAPTPQIAHPSYAAFMQLLYSVQQEANYLQQSVYNIAIHPSMRQDIAVQLDRCANVFINIVPMLLSMIDELGARCPLEGSTQYQLSPAQMTALTELCAGWQAAATADSTLNRRRKRPQPILVNGFADRGFVSKFTTLANKMEELPIRLRATFMDLRNMDDRETYKFFQDWLLYQGTAPISYTITAVPLPIACSYMGPTLAVWASDLRHIVYNDDGSATLLPNVPIHEAGQFGVSGSSSGRRA